MKKIKQIQLSTGKKVPCVSELTEAELNYLMLTPIERNMPEDIKDYLRNVEKRFFSLTK